VGAVAVAISIGTIASIVGEEGGTALELGVGGVDTGVNDVGASVGACTAVIGVR
jgi:hypothetical protein